MTYVYNGIEEKHTSHPVGLPRGLAAVIARKNVSESVPRAQKDVPPARGPRLDLVEGPPRPMPPIFHFEILYYKYYFVYSVTSANSIIKHNVTLI